MRLGIVGTGMISCEAIPVFMKLGITPTALCSTKRSIEKAGLICAKYKISALYTDLEQMIMHSRIDTVYLGIPNILHYSFARTALLNGVNVIVEKPFTTNSREADELADLARQKGLCLLEAISTLYLPAYKKLQEWLPEIGEIRLATCNFSQYSSRYDNFKKGIIAPVFDPACAGGALMDLNIYNIHFLTGLLGFPEAVHYLANVERGIDTSGILTLTYPDFKCVSIAAKDCKAPCSYVIQGTKGYLLCSEPANGITKVSLVLNDAGRRDYDANTLNNEAAAEVSNRMEAEFSAFIDLIHSKNLEECEKRLEHSLKVMNVLTKARESAGIRFSSDFVEE